MWADVPIILHAAAALSVSARVLMRPRLEPPVRLAWVLMIVVVPLVGIAAYVLFGEIRLRRGYLQTRRHVRERLGGRWRRGPHDLTALPGQAEPVLQSGRAVGGFPPVDGNELHILPEDDSAIEAIAAEIDGARDHAHLLFYIWLPDPSGIRVAEACIRAAGRGVAVRVIVDAVGSRLLLRSDHWARMKAAGVECRAAYPVVYPFLQVLFQRIDLRNHRKIVVIDNSLAFTGSRNCADTAFAIKPRFAPWIDILVRIEGPVVRQLQTAFLADWMSYTGQDLSHMLDGAASRAHPGAIAQVIATGPDRRQASMSDSITTLIHSARHRLTITTPYYVPEQPLDAAIRTVARRGVRVTLILPERNDSLFVNATSQGLWHGLLSAGVEMRLFRGGLIHSKIITVDGQMAMLGSANLDRRSFELNYELNLMVVDKTLTAELDERQRSYVLRSRLLTLAEVRRWPWWRRLRNNILALAAPLL